MTKFQTILNKFELPWVSLKDFLPDSALEIANQAVKNAGPDKVGLTFEKMPVGKIALGDYAIGMKHWPSGEMDAEATRGWEQYARSIIVSYLAVDQLCEKVSVKRIIRYNDYANNMAVRFVGNKHNIPVFSISHAPHRGVDLQRVFISPELPGAILREELQAWPLWRELPLPAEMIHEITADIFERFSSHSALAYSPAKTRDAGNIRLSLGFD